ncbi:MAG: carboxypeptidase regulatory-like domain-containing protein [Planctomycetota bacterium]|nr:carboxypeptidase regulatory-like domain-containing protein [Planctomycetota bacterium]
MNSISLTTSLAPTLIDLALKATVLLTLAWGASFALRRSSAAVRHRLWGLTLCGLLALPLLTWLLPTWRISVLPAQPLAVEISQIPLPSSLVANTESEIDRTELDVRFPPREAELFLSQDNLGPEPVTADSQTPASPVFNPLNGPVREHVLDEPTVTAIVESPRSHGWASLLIGIWLTGTGLGIISLGIAAWNCVRITLDSKQMSDTELDRLAREVKCRLNLHRHVELREHPRAIVPLTCGVVRPVVLLPVAARNWPEEMRRAVLLHELAHVARRDVAWQWLGRLACAFYWCHPLAWLGLQQMRVERELACDDAVVDTGERASDYARQLLEVARQCGRVVGQSPLRMAVAVEMTRGGKLEQRVRALFDSARSHTGLKRRIGITLLLATAILVPLIAVVHPVARMVTQTANAAEEKPQPADLAAPPVVDVELARDELSIPPVSGRVVSIGGKPIPGAKVFLRYRNWAGSRFADEPLVSRERGSVEDRQDELATTRTDAQGRFEFRNLKAKRAYDWQDELDLDVVASHPGKAITWYHLAGPATLKMGLPEEAKLSGRVGDAEGNPVAGADVRPAWIMSLRHLTQADLEEGRWPSPHDRHFVGLLNAQAPPDAVTNDAGEFTLSGLPAGLGVRLRISSPHFAPVWFDAATVKELDADLLKKTKRPVATGELRVTLQDRRYPFSLRVVDDLTGDPVENVTLKHRSDRNAMPIPVRNVTSSQPGVYELSRLPPRFDILAEAPLEQGYLGVWKLLSPAEGSTGEIRLTRGKRISGRVVDAESGEGIPNVTLRTSAVDIDTFRGRIPQMSRTDAAGRCVVLLAPSTYSLTFASEVPGYLTQTKNNGQHEIVYQNVTVEEGVDTPPFEIRLKRSRRIEGVVVDTEGIPLEGITYQGVFRVGSPPKLDGGFTTGGSMTSSFRGESAPDGRFMISEPFTRFDAVSTLPLDVVFYDKRRRLVGQLLVDTRETIEPARVVMRPAVRLTGRVVGSDGAPQSNVVVEAYVSGRASSERMSYTVGAKVRTGKDGRFEIFAGIPDRRVEVVADHRTLGRKGVAGRLDASAVEHDMSDLVFTRPQTPYTMTAPAPDAAGLMGLAAFEKLTADYAKFIADLQEARQSPRGWPTVTNSSTWAFTAELLRINEAASDPELDLKTHVWIVGQHNVSSIGEPEFVESRSKSAARLLELYSDRPELAPCVLNLIRFLPVKGQPPHVWHAAALKLLESNPDRTVQGIACYEAAESRLFPQGYTGDGREPPADIIAESIPLLERVVNGYAEVKHPWRQVALGELAAGWLFDLRQLERGATVPELEWKAIDGKPVRLADYRGKLVVIDCCSIGSGTALGETEHSRLLIKQAGPEKAVTITVVYDDVEEVRKNAAKFADSTVVIAGDEAVRFFRLWNVQGWPTAFVIDAEGKVRAKRIRDSVLAEVLAELTR